MTSSFSRPIRLSRLLVPSILLLALISVAPTAAAQTVADARIVEFGPSADHNQTLSDGRPVVERYVFRVYPAGGSLLLQSVDMGKPAPEADGVVRYDFSAAAKGWSLPGGEYESRVEAIGPGGTAVSGLSNRFTLAASCSYALSGSSASFPSEGGGGGVTLSTGASCAWTASSSVSWVTLGTTQGTGPASIIFTVALNTSASSRTGTLTIAGTTYTVTQQGAGCGFALSSSTQTFAAAGGTGTVAVTSAGGCSWTASSNAAWITVNSGSTGSGAGTVTYSVTSNSTSTTRTGTVTIAGLTHTVNQAGGTVSASLPIPWQPQDIGQVGLAGTAAHSAGVFTVQGAGTGIAGNSDGFHFVYQPVAANGGDIVARVASVASTCAGGKAGVMLRESAAAGSRQIAVVALSSGGVEVLLRSSPGGKTSSIARLSGSVPSWLRLTRSGRTVSIFASSNGSSWQKVAAVNAKFTGSALAGLAVTSGDTTLQNKATFDSVVVR